MLRWGILLLILLVVLLPDSVSWVLEIAFFSDPFACLLFPELTEESGVMRT